jgi:hypothetical protein
MDWKRTDVLGQGIGFGGTFWLNWEEKDQIFGAGKREKYKTYKFFKEEARRFGAESYLRPVIVANYVFQKEEEFRPKPPTLKGKKWCCVELQAVRKREQFGLNNKHFKLTQLSGEKEGFYPITPLQVGEISKRRSQQLGVGRRKLICEQYCAEFSDKPDRKRRNLVGPVKFSQARWDFNH